MTERDDRTDEDKSKDKTRDGDGVLEPLLIIAPELVDDGEVDAGDDDDEEVEESEAELEDDDDEEAEAAEEWV